MTTTSLSDDIFITARPEDVLLASVAYSRPEMLSLDNIIALRSSNRLLLDPAANCNASSSITAIPTELLLRIRAHLQSALVAQLAHDAAAALDEYQSALVEGICPDCFWWQNDVYGPDVWAWIENGYRGACSCVVSGDIDPRTPSETKRRITEKYEGIDIGTRGQWLRAYLARTYLDESTTAWRHARSVLSELGCSYKFERIPLPPPLRASSAVHAPSGEAKKTPRRTTTCDFGALVRIGQSPERSTSEDPAITFGRLLRELALKAPADDEPSIALRSSASRFVDKICRRSACATHFLAQRGPACNCVDCLAVFASPASLKTTLASLAFGAVSLIYLVARVAV